MYKVAHSKYGFCLECKENTVGCLVIESPQLFTSLIKELVAQSEGEVGNFAFSSQGELLDIGKYIAVIKEPFSVEVNGKKILTKLYQEIAKDIDDEYCEERAEFYQSYIRYMDYIIGESDLYLTYDEEPDVQELLKAGKVHIEDKNSTLLEVIVEYIKVSNSLLKQKLFIFVNLKSFLTKEELEMLYKECFYRKVSLLLLEANYHEKGTNERVCIIDKDQCIIYL